MSMSKTNLIEEAKIFKALGHPTRLLLVHTLREEGERCVQYLRDLAGDDISTISRHLTQLREAGILSTRREGTHIYYKVEAVEITDNLAKLESVIQNKNQERALPEDPKEES